MSPQPGRKARPLRTAAQMFPDSPIRQPYSDSREAFGQQSWAYLRHDRSRQEYCGYLHTAEVKTIEIHTISVLPREAARLPSSDAQPGKAKRDFPGAQPCEPCAA